jgi:hypothetical protein
MLVKQGQSLLDVAGFFETGWRQILAVNPAVTDGDGAFGRDTIVNVGLRFSPTRDMDIAVRAFCAREADGAGRGGGAWRDGGWRLFGQRRPPGERRDCCEGWRDRLRCPDGLWRAVIADGCIVHLEHGEQRKADVEQRNRIGVEPTLVRIVDAIG